MTVYAEKYVFGSINNVLCNVWDWGLYTDLGFFFLKKEIKDVSLLRVVSRNMVSRKRKYGYVKT
jgi:hypothetical protein